MCVLCVCSYLCVCCVYVRVCVCSMCVHVISKIVFPQALSVMEKWQPMSSQGALELLTPRFTHPMVKKYAICQLQQADNEVITNHIILCFQNH